jgi:hypothetical protein
MRHAHSTGVAGASRITDRLLGQMVFRSVLRRGRVGLTAVTKSHKIVAISSVSYSQMEPHCSTVTML